MVAPFSADKVGPVTDRMNLLVETAHSGTASQIAEALAGLGADAGQEAVLAALRRHLEAGRARIRAGFEAGGGAETVHRDLARLMDELIGAALDFAVRHLYRADNPTLGEEIALLAVGGYGRGELAPFSDIDLLFLHPYKRTPLVEQLAEFLLIKLWDLKLKVGHATRSMDECLRLAGQDLTVLTALLEARPVWGSKALFGRFRERFRHELVIGHEARFVEAKLAERDARHQRLGDSRYLLEPNIKEGKGGLRDLHTLMWLGRFLYDATSPSELVKHGVLSPDSLRVFARSRRFLWTVRCHLHYLTGRPEERLTFELQPRIAAAMGYRDRPRSLGVERFMKRYYLVARDVGNLTRIVCAALEEQHKRRPRLAFRFGFGRRRIGGFRVIGNRVSLADPELFAREPIRMLELFRIAQERELDLHPDALRAVDRHLKRIDRRLREDPAANRLFLEMMTAREDPALTLTRLNESGVLGKFVPEFGHIVAQMQHTLYHVYTTDEHTIRAIEVLHRIERGELAEDHPLATELLPEIHSRTELYLATFLHDIGKGRGGDHSEIGAAIAARLCRRFGLAEDATATVVWLVRHHLLMSTTAFRRDIEDPTTISDFMGVVQSPERLKLLLLLTVADIRAVGPGVWNGWKGQLLRELYYETLAAMTSEDPRGRRRERIEVARRDLAGALARDTPPWPEERIAAWIERHEPGYWLAFPVADLARHARSVAAADAAGRELCIEFRPRPFQARTELLVYAPDHPGLFMKIAGALALSRVTIVDARIFTTTDGMALDLIGLQEAETRQAIEDEGRLARLRRNLERAIAGEMRLEEELAAHRRRLTPARLFRVEPRVIVDNRASRLHTVVEVSGRDRPGLLYDLARVFKDHALVIKSAHIATYGARVVDVFYVKDVFGMKLAQEARIARLRKALLEVLAQA